MSDALARTASAEAGMRRAREDMLAAGREKARLEAQAPATHAVLTQLKAGDTAYQAVELRTTLRASEIHHTVRPT